MDVNRVRVLKTSCNEFKDIKCDAKFVEQLVYEWIRRMKAYSDFTLSNSIIQSMAIQFKLVLNMPWFFPHTDWINKFRDTYNMKSASSTRVLHIGYKEKKSVQVRDIIRELLHTVKSKKDSKVRVTNEAVVLVSDGPDVEIIEIEDEIKQEYEEKDFDIPHSASTAIAPDTANFEEVIIDGDQPSSVSTAKKIADEVRKDVDVIEVVDFEKELPSSVVLNYTTQKESEDVLDDVLNTDDIEDYIPTIVCSPKVLKFEQPKQKKTHVPVSVRAAQIKLINPPDDIPKKRSREARYSYSAKRVKNIVKETSSLSMPKTPVCSAPINVKLTESLDPRKQEAAANVVGVPAPISITTFNIPSTVTIARVPLSTDVPKTRTRFSNRQPLKTREEALRCIKLMEEFAMMKENFRLIGFIERLEKLIQNGN